MSFRERKSYAEMMKELKVSGGSPADGTYFCLDMTVGEFEHEFGLLRRVNTSKVKDVEIDIRKECPQGVDQCGTFKLVRRQEM